MTKDPIKFAGGDTSIYNYAANDPVNNTDITGLADACEKDKCKQKAKDAFLDCVNNVGTGEIACIFVCAQACLAAGPAAFWCVQNCAGVCTFGAMAGAVACGVGYIIQYNSCPK